jgi:hypothetical protein
MTETDATDRSIDSMLSESGFGDDRELREILVEVRADAVAVHPLPSPAVARLLTRIPSRRTTRHRRYVVVAIVGAAVLGGGAAAASPLLPEAATVVISGLLGTAPSSVVPTVSPSERPADGTRQGDSDQVPPTPTPHQGGGRRPSSVPTPPPGHGGRLPEPAQTHPVRPIPLPSPHSTHPDDHPHS